MKKALDLLKELKEKSPEWKDLMLRFMDGDLEDTDDLYNAVFSVFREIREIYKTTKKIPEDIIKELNDPEQVSLINDYIKNSLGWYFDLSLLRELQEEHADLAKKLVSIILEEFIFHVGINGNKKIHDLLDGSAEYDEKVLDGIIKALAHFTNYSIINNLNCECIQTSVQIEGALPEELCIQIAELIWKNRIELKIDYIIHQIGDVGSALKSL